MHCSAKGCPTPRVGAVLQHISPTGGHLLAVCGAGCCATGVWGWLAARLADRVSNQALSEGIMGLRGTLFKEKGQAIELCRLIRLS